MSAKENFRKSPLGWRALRQPLTANHIATVVESPDPVPRSSGTTRASGRQSRSGSHRADCAAVLRGVQPQGRAGHGHCIDTVSVRGVSVAPQLRAGFGRSIASGPSGRLQIRIRSHGLEESARPQIATTQSNDHLRSPGPMHTAKTLRTGSADQRRAAVWSRSHVGNPGFGCAAGQVRRRRVLLTGASRLRRLGDDVCEDSRADNARAMNHGERILSVYRMLDAATLERMTSEKRSRSPTIRPGCGPVQRDG
jgi:hypothetical protein